MYSRQAAKPQRFLSKTLLGVFAPLRDDFLSAISMQLTMDNKQRTFFAGTEQKDHK